MPRKPLALLKVLIAHGGKAVPEYRLVDILWPGEDADRAIKALDINVVRLRGLLGHADAITAGDELVSLNSKVCWVDVWTFESHVRSVRSISDSREVDGGLEQALELYRGEFLPGEPEAGWVVKQRERLREQFLSLIQLAGERFESACQWENAVACYQRGLETDQLAEGFYQGLMRCYRALGRTAEAMSTFRRLRQILSVVLGMSPSAASQALAREIQESSPARFESPSIPQEQ
jgi:two-component SAPR family response regulator